MNSAQRYNFDQIRKDINDQLLNENMPNKLYKSIEGISSIINAIVKTKGDNWAAQVINDEGNMLLTKEEQITFSEAFQPYLDTIVAYFDKDSDEENIDYNLQKEQEGGEYNPDISKLSGMSSNFLKTKVEQATHRYPPVKSDPTKMIGVDDIYSKIVDRIGHINSTVNDYASKYGILKLEKEHDLEGDIRLIPQAAAPIISQGVFALAAIPPMITQEFLSKIKVPFRSIVSIIYVILDVSRVAISVSGLSTGRKILSILLSLLELLRGDWKKAILSMAGYYGTVPLLIGQLVKVYLTAFRMLSPQIQQSIIFGSLDTSKSLLIGLCLSIFQVTAPEEVRLPLIGVLEKIAQKKAEMDGTLEDIGLSARPEYLSPTFEDLNNIQAVMSDDAFICSCEFEELIKSVNKAPVINFVLQILRIPVNKEFREYKCGAEPCKDFVTSVVKNAKDNTIKQMNAEKPFSMDDLQMPIELDPSDKLTKPVQQAQQEQQVEEPVQQEKQAEEPVQQEKQVEEPVQQEQQVEEPVQQEQQLEEPVQQNNRSRLLTKGGRILHSRSKKIIA